MGDRVFEALRRVLCIGGATALLLWPGACLRSALLDAHDRRAFAEELAPVSAPPPAAAAAEAKPVPSLAVGEPDTSAWAPSRLASYLDALLVDPPVQRLARLELPSVALEVMVLDGTDEWTLNRGVGRIEGTAHVDEDGNLGIAGHRDGFFRPLRKLAVGDPLRLVTREGVREYRVEWIRIVSPEDVSVLDPTDAPSVTLVTCYPFHYVGNAPKRYIVRAVEVASS